jgi:hypothetical protein
MAKPRVPTEKVLRGIYHQKFPAFSSAPLGAPTSQMKFPTTNLLATRAQNKPNPKVKATKKALWGGSSGKKISNESRRQIVQNPKQVGKKSDWHAGVSKIGTHVTKDNNVGMRDPSNHVWASRDEQEVLNLSPNLPGKAKKKVESKAKPAPARRLDRHDIELRKGKGCRGAVGSEPWRRKVPSPHDNPVPFSVVHAFNCERPSV